MWTTLQSIASLLASYGLLLMANGLFSTLLGVRGRLEGFGADVIGMVMGIYFAGLLIGALFGAHFLNRVGHIRGFATCASVMSITALVHVMFVDPWVWAGMRIISGMCMAGMVMCTESWLNGRASNNIRGRVLALYMITNYACAGAGQFLLPLADPSEFVLFCLVSMLMSLALVPVLLTRAVAPAPQAPEKGGFSDIFRLAPLGIIGASAAGMQNAAFNTMGPVYAQSIGLSVIETSGFMGAAILGGLLLQLPMGWLSDRMDRRHLLTGAAFCVTLLCLAMAFGIGGRGASLTVLAAVYGSVAFTVYSLAAAHANDRAGSEKSVRVASAMLVAYGVGAIAGPMLAGQAMSLLGPSGLFQQSAVIMGTLTIYALYRLVVRPERPEAQPFVPVPGTQYSSTQLAAAAREEAAEDATRPDMVQRKAKPS